MPGCVAALNTSRSGSSPDASLSRMLDDADRAIDQPVVVFCTTENDMSQIQEAMTAGANEYIMKPFDTEIIESKFVQVGLI